MSGQSHIIVYKLDMLAAVVTSQAWPCNGLSWLLISSQTVVIGMHGTSTVAMQRLAHPVQRHAKGVTSAAEMCLRRHNFPSWMQCRAALTEVLTQALAAAAAPLKGGVIRDTLTSHYPRLAGVLEETFRRIMQATDVSPHTPAAHFLAAAAAAYASAVACAAAIACAAAAAIACTAATAWVVAPMSGHLHELWQCQLKYLPHVAFTTELHLLSYKT